MKIRNGFDQQIPGIFMSYFLRTEVQIMFVILYSLYTIYPQHLSYVVRSLYYIALQRS